MSRVWYCSKCDNRIHDSHMECPHCNAPEIQQGLQDEIINLELENETLKEIIEVLLVTPDGLATDDYIKAMKAWNEIKSTLPKSKDEVETE